MFKCSLGFRVESLSEIREIDCKRRRLCRYIWNECELSWQLTNGRNPFSKSFHNIYIQLFDIIIFYINVCVLPFPYEISIIHSSPKSITEHLIRFR